MIKKTKSIQEYESMSLAELRKEAEEFKLENYTELLKRELLLEVLKKKTEKDGYINVEGLLEVQKDGTHGVLRTSGVLEGENDVYISGSQIKKFGLKTGDLVTGPARLPKDKEKYLSLLRVDQVYGKPASEAPKRPQFRKLTPVFPNRQIKLETTSDVL
ncbi:MAG: Rho termination factor N-terminal domain-containing protein, partial [Candidatus Dojkabacteria bacterium]